MSVTAAGLIHPNGVLPVDWFVTADLDVWIAAGEDTAPAEATPEQADAITTAYAYWRAHEAKARSVVGSPDSMSLDGLGSLSTSNGRYDRLMSLAAQYRSEWESAVAGATDEVEVVPGPPLASWATVIVPTW